ncbi:MAG TPA: ATP-binding protein [Opitutaceae bacterium]|jgi:signal transduction histidine kinase|nr:ATP-binding protein [Opitutaceae bacterium]
MKNSQLLIKGRNENLIAMVTGAMASAFPGSRVLTLDSAVAAEAAPHVDGAEILILVEPVGGEASTFQEILNERKLPRWAVIACEGPLAPNNWTAPLAPQILSLAWAAQVLRREVATLRGNIRSLGVRVAHDMRTPLGGVLSAAETLRESLAESDPSNLVWVDNIIESEADLLRLVRHQTMLAEELARPLEISEFNMGVAVSSALEWLEGKLALSNFVVSKPAEWPTLRGDRRKYERVWNLLIENSVRHGGGGRRIELGWEESEGICRFWISNDGPPVQTEKQATLFRPFHRLHEPNSGRGLSLSLMEELVHAQGGTSGYGLGPGGNPTFYFTAAT